MTDFDKCQCEEIHEKRVVEAISEMPDEDAIIELSELFSMFSDSTRVKILLILLKGELCVCDIAVAINASVSAVSHQLRLLKQARLVKKRREGKSIFYSLSDDHVFLIINQGLQHIEE